MLALSIWGLLGPVGHVIGQDSATEKESEGSTEKAAEEITLPDIGIRMTPDLLNAMTYRFAEAMRENLELNQQQTTDIEGILKTHLVKLTNDHAENGRDVIEMMMATMIRNDGRFPKEDAVIFAKKIKPLIQPLRDYFSTVSTEVGKKLDFKQRLKFSAQMGAVMSGMTIFEQRMLRWEEGKVGDNANPFDDPDGDDPEQANSDPNEHPEHRKARREVERWSDWELRIDKGWEEYLKKAADFYEFDDSQRTSGDNVLKQMKERAAAVKTDDWKEKIKQNRIAKRLARRGGGDLGEGPIVFVLDREYENLRKPLMALDEEFKRRVEELPTSKQRDSARQKARKFLADRGMKAPPV